MGSCTCTRWTAALGRSGERCSPFGRGRHCQRVLGFVGKVGAEASLEASCRHDPGANRLSS